MNCEQKEVLGVVESGHNVFITGQACTGKSFLIGKIFQTLKKRGEKVVIVCSSGIATTVHDDLGTYVRTVTVPPNGFQKSFSGPGKQMVDAINHFKNSFT